MKAYITLLSTFDYLPGVMVLQESLRQVGSSYPLWVAISQRIPEDVETFLEDNGLEVIRVPKHIEIPSALKEKSGHWGNTFEKLHLFGLTNFEKLVYIDSDMMVLENIDELFDKPHMSAVAAGRLVHPGWRRLNSGLMVIVPQYHLPEKIAGALQKAISETQSLGNEYLGDQDVINAYYGEWQNLKNLHLDDGYNMFYSDIDAYANMHAYYFPPVRDEKEKMIRVVHFVGRHKPWMNWAGPWYFYKALKKKTPSKLERKAFLMYRRLLAQVESFRGS